MRWRIWIITTSIVACGSFGAADSADKGADNGADDDADAGVSPDGGGVPDGNVPGTDAGDATVGPAADAACDASRRCIDFESPAQRREDASFGFDLINVEVDGGLAIVQGGGFLSSAGLRARAVDSSLSRGVLRFDTTPPVLRVRMKVRADERVDNGASSNHFLVFNCDQGENFSVKFSLEGAFAIQVADQGEPIGTYDLGAWIPFDAVVTNGAGTRSLTTTRLDIGETSTVTSNETCEPPLLVRIGASNISGNADVSLSVDDIAIDWN